MGWCTMEEYVYGDNQHKWVRPGYLHTKGPGAYKIPAFNDTPLDFNVYLLKDAPNPTSLHSSKAVGEPPFFLSTCVFFAIKNAITHARAENDVQGFFQMQAPATSERIRMACCDEITERFVPDSSSGDNFFQTKGSF
jgi:xanthine dehydrogenase/oxidase